MSRRHWFSILKRLCLTSPLANFGHPFIGRGAILTYHSITKDPLPPVLFAPNRPIQIHVDDFKQQIAYLAKNYRCLGMDEGIEGLKRGNLPERTVLITFDDGYSDNLEVALPILDQYRVPATIFITVGLVDRSFSPWWFDLEYLLSKQDQISFNTVQALTTLQIRTPAQKNIAFRRLNQLLMLSSPADQKAILTSLKGKFLTSPSWSHLTLSWDQVAELSRHSLITLGSHTISHPVLNRLNFEELFHEFHYSKVLLERKTGKTIHYLCYPFGSLAQVGNREYSAAEKAGYDAAFTTTVENLTPSHKRTLFSLPRLNVTYGESLIELQWKLKGFDTLVHRYARWS